MAYFSLFLFCSSLCCDFFLYNKIIIMKKHTHTLTHPTCNKNHIIWLFSWPVSHFIFNLNISLVWLIFNVNLIFDLRKKKKTETHKCTHITTVYIFYRSISSTRCCAPTPTIQRFQIDSMPNFDSLNCNSIVIALPFLGFFFFVVLLRISYLCW